MIEVEDLGRDYLTGESRLKALDGLDLSVAEKEFVAITGPSGSGKSTLLGLLAGLDRPTRGRILIDGTDITRLDEDALSDLRGRKMGFVFQSFQLIQTLTALENVRVPAEILGDFAAAERAPSVLEKVGLAGRIHHYPNQLSGGEMQRVAIARASITRPRILFADEPTGNLDSHNGQIVMDMLMEMNRECTLVLVTHNHELARLADREIRLRDGRVDQIVVNKKRGGSGAKARAQAGGRNGVKSKAAGRGAARASSSNGKKPRRTTKKSKRP